MATARAVLKAVPAEAASRVAPVNRALPAAASQVVAEAVRRVGLVNRAVPAPVALDAAARPDSRVVPAWVVVLVVLPGVSAPT